ncbi:sulfatase-like hydrolase/transferase [Planctomycetota bacterium]
MAGLLVLSSLSLAQETLPPLQDGKAPQTHAELWADYDPRAEPLDVEVLKEWEEDGVVLKVLRYRVGIFKGQKAMMAAVYGYPKGGKNLPGLVQIHGGGQYADYRAPLTNAKRGYATLSISWAGRINAPDYKVSPDEVKLFWEDKTDDPKYRLTTDWGALDAYHAPTRSGLGSFGNTKPSEWTLDSVESPRNNQWFLCTLGARRALTFLEQQPEVDKTRLGVYGHSMGGKLTVLCAGADSRVKAAVPSCGGISGRSGGKEPSGDDVSLEKISCPILFQSPANDFHGRINDLQRAVTEIQSTDWRVTCSPHHNHQDTANYEVASQLWFDQQLKGIFTLPATPQIVVNLEAKGGIPTIMVTADQSNPILAVEVYYTQQGQMDGLKDNRENTKNRFWHYAETTKHGKSWHASLPLSNTDQPLWVYANVTYSLNESTAYAGYYYGVGLSEAFNLSSLMFIATADQLKAAGVQPTLKPSLMIETFAGDWDRQWFSYMPEDWERKTHKIYDEIWKAPADAKLAVDGRAEQGNKLVIGIDSYAAEVELSGGDDWQSILLSSTDFKNGAGESLADWKGIRELRLGATETLKGKNKSLTLGEAWKGPDPEFRNLRWIESKADQVKPNVIFIKTDDQRFDSLSMTGHPVTKTPNIDRLAKEGVFFSNAFITSPICGPSRANFFTGQWERKNRQGFSYVSKNHIPAEQFDKSWILQLKQAGYFTGYIGKHHAQIGPQKEKNQYMKEQIDFCYMKGGHLGFDLMTKKEFQNLKNSSQVEGLFEATEVFMRPGKDKDYFYENADASVKDFLTERDKSKPFCLSINFNLPHAASIGGMGEKASDPEMYRTLYNDKKDDFVFPEGYPTTKSSLPDDVFRQDELMSYYRLDKNYLSDKKIKMARAVTAIDMFVGNLRALLGDMDLDNNTILVFCSDHGLLLGEHGLGGKTFLYEECIRVPMIFYSPFFTDKESGKTIDELVVGQDLPATILELCGLSVPNTYQGQSMVPLIQDKKVQWRKEVFYENLFTDQDYPRMEAVRGTQWKYIRYFSKENDRKLYLPDASINGEQPIYEELFNLKDDPQEQKNLAADSKYVKILEAQRKRCQELVTELAQ